MLKQIITLCENKYMFVKMKPNVVYRDLRRKLQQFKHSNNNSLQPLQIVSQTQELVLMSQYISFNTLYFRSV